MDYGLYVMKEDTRLPLEIDTVIYRSVLNAGCLDEDRFHKS